MLSIFYSCTCIHDAAGRRAVIDINAEKSKPVIDQLVESYMNKSDLN